MENKGDLIDDIRTALNFYEALSSNKLYYKPNDDQKYLLEGKYFTLC